MTKQEEYDTVIAQIKAVLDGEPNTTARMATVSCLLAEAFPERFYWTGFYVVDAVCENELVVGPYQGTLGCLRIKFGKGVCGTAAATRQTQVVADVHAIENHIACDSRTSSEIVVPVVDAVGKLIAVLDVDSTVVDAFDHIDQVNLESLMVSVFAG